MRRTDSQNTNSFGAQFLYPLRRELAASVVLVIALVVRLPIWIAVLVAGCAWALCHELTRRTTPPEPTIAQQIAEFESIAAQLPATQPSPYERFLSALRAVDSLPDTILDPILTRSVLRESLTVAIRLGRKCLSSTQLNTNNSLAEQEYRQLIDDLASKLDSIHANAQNQHDQELRSEVAAFRELLIAPQQEETIRHHG